MEVVIMTLTNELRKAIESLHKHFFFRRNAYE